MQTPEEPAREDPDCPRLHAELTILRSMPHTTDSDIERREADHRAWHPCPRDHDPGHLPRDPHQESP